MRPRVPPHITLLAGCSKCGNASESTCRRCGMHLHTLYKCPVCRRLHCSKIFCNDYQRCQFPQPATKRKREEGEEPQDNVEENLPPTTKKQRGDDEKMPAFASPVLDGAGGAQKRRADDAVSAEKPAKKQKRCDRAERPSLPAEPRNAPSQLHETPEIRDGYFKVIVGEAKAEFIVSESALKRDSRYFRGLLRSGMIENRTRVVVLDE
ncbi:hypothetical protein ABW19_dt0200030 [Dactylella cylindrospora]|nr:hypothetical protein ABW19_dt0200030 [Dactylella cylindrospora]